MNLTDFSPRRWRERQRERQSTDFADMGTAFGLDASFALEATQRPEAPVPSAEPGKTAEAASPAATGLRWWQRAPGR